MKKLLSLPPNLVDCFHEITNTDHSNWFCTNDPIGAKLGSGGGTTWALTKAQEAQWIKEGERAIILHAGGQSRRLPAYAPSGKILTPIPVFRWARGQRLSQSLLDLQLPLYEEMMKIAPQSLTTMVVSGDVYIRANQPLQPIPEADIVCYGLWVEPSLAKNHGVFVSKRNTPDTLEYMLQKPSIETLANLMQEHYFLMDIGIWIFSDKAIRLLKKRSLKDPQKFASSALIHSKSEATTLQAEDLHFYDMYSEFGLALGANPRIIDSELNDLKVAILPLEGGEFHHYGTSSEMISSTVKVQNTIIDQREIMRKGVKVHPCIFIQNADCKLTMTVDNANTWIENSHIASTWKLGGENIITGVPRNNWHLSLPKSRCIDIVPIGENQWVVRPYAYNDPHPSWLFENLGLSVCNNPQTEARIYPIVDDIESMGIVADWMLNGNDKQSKGESIWMNCKKMTADEISAYANLRRLTAQRTAFRNGNWSQLAANWEKSVFYQLNLKDAAEEFLHAGIPEPAPLPETASRVTRISDAMFRATLLNLQAKESGSDTKEEAKRYESTAFSLMREGLTETLIQRQTPHLNVYSDQIVWSRCPVRIDLAGGWTDTPPYSLMTGGNVVNIAIELNGQPPIQVYIKPCKERHIILRSIDLGASERIETFEDLQQFNRIGSPFSIPKAALVLAGFSNRFSAQTYRSLSEQLDDFGSGIEMTMLSAIPAGSGLGTSSILAATVLGAINDFCGLNWDKFEISNRTLVLEQLLTSGGGWQDQYGGVMHGVKLLQTSPGWQQQPLIRWLPDTLWTSPNYTKCHLLYYTGITRTAKGILDDIVRGMFLNETNRLETLAQMKQHALDLYDVIQRGDFNSMGQLIAKTWRQNQDLDGGTNPPSVQAISNLIDDLCLGYKLPGAGGGGYLYMVAKDPEAATRIRKILSTNPPNDKARFVEMTLSQKGLEITKS